MLRSALYLLAVLAVAVHCDSTEYDVVEGEDGVRVVVNYNYGKGGTDGAGGTGNNANQMAVDQLKERMRKAEQRLDALEARGTVVGK